MPPSVLSTTDEVIAKLGGNNKVAELCGVTGKAVSNWRGGKSGRNKFPAETYLQISHALNNLGMTAPPSLWGMGEPRCIAPVERRVS